jgi:flagellar biosynthesis/type III secretory pathway protein FliH
MTTIRHIAYRLALGSVLAIGSIPTVAITSAAAQQRQPQKGGGFQGGGVHSVAFSRGYRQGFRDGLYDGRTGEGYQPDRSLSRVSPDSTYESAYERGYRQGYRDGYRQASAEAPRWPDR